MKKRKCRKCQKTKPLTEFYASKKDHRNNCKYCCRIYARTNPRQTENRKKYEKTQKGKLVRRLIRKKYDLENPAGRIK